MFFFDLPTVDTHCIQCEPCKALKVSNSGDSDQTLARLLEKISSAGTSFQRQEVSKATDPIHLDKDNQSGTLDNAQPRFATPEIN